MLDALAVETEEGELQLWYIVENKTGQVYYVMADDQYEIKVEREPAGEKEVAAEAGKQVGQQIKENIDGMEIRLKNLNDLFKDANLKK